MTCRINLDSKVVGPIDLPEGEKWVSQYEGEPDSIHGWWVGLIYSPLNASGNPHNHNGS